MYIEDENIEKLYIKDAVREMININRMKIRKYIFVIIPSRCRFIQIFLEQNCIKNATSFRKLIHIFNSNNTFYLIINYIYNTNYI